MFARFMTSNKRKQMLTGTDLLSKVKDLGDMSKTDLARSCGYVSVKDGGERVNFTAFYEPCLKPKVSPFQTVAALLLVKADASCPTKLWFRAMAIC